MRHLPWVSRKTNENKYFQAEHFTYNKKKYSSNSCKRQEKLFEHFSYENWIKFITLHSISAMDSDDLKPEIS